MRRLSTFQGLKCRLQSLFIAGDQPVPGGVGHSVNLLARRIGIEPFHAASDAVAETRGSHKIRHKPLDFGIIKHAGMRLVPEQTTGKLRQAGGDKI